MRGSKRSDEAGSCLFARLLTIPLYFLLHRSIHSVYSRSALAFFSSLAPLGLPRSARNTGYAAYDRLTPRYKSFLEGLEAYHTNAHRHYAGLESFAKNEQGAYAVRRGPHVALHPVIRTHPLTNWKTLYVNQNFTTQIKGLSRVESDSVLQFLYGHAIDEEFKVRFRWEKDSVAIWDNMSISVAFTF